MPRAHFFASPGFWGLKVFFPPSLDSGALWGHGQKELEISHNSLLDAPAPAGGNLHHGEGIHELLGRGAACGTNGRRTCGCYGAFSG